ncbi:hypothetical protein ACFDTO_09875 [Microbacteriaceae bacterium 4G12]
MRLPSGEAVTELIVPLTVGAKVLISAPVCRLKARRLERGTLPTPTALPAGRALAKDPPAYTVLPTMVVDQMMPSIWTVGRTSVETVSGTPAAGAVSANAGETPTSAVTVRTARAAAKARRRAARGMSIGGKPSFG